MIAIVILYYKMIISHHWCFSMNINKVRTADTVKAQLNNLSVDWFIVCCFTSHLGIFHLFIDVTFANLGLCSALMVCKQWGIFLVPHLLWHEPFIYLFILGLIWSNVPICHLWWQVTILNRNISYLSGRTRREPNSAGKPREVAIGFYIAE